MDSYTPDVVQQVVKTMGLRPDLLKLTTFALECMANASERHGPIPPGAPMLSDASRLSALALVSQGSDTTIVSAHAVSHYEKITYYNGIADEGEHPDLLYRTGSDKYPWIKPAGRHAHPPTKSLREVYGTPLNEVWSTVSLQVCELVKGAVGTRFSIDPARFATRTHGEEGEGTLSPVVIWVAVYPGSTSADTAHEVSQAILELLGKNGIEDVEVEWREAVTFRMGGPALLRVVDSDDSTAHVRRHLTAAHGIPIATAEMEEQDAQGTITLFFHENRDKNGDPSTKVFAVSNHHVLRKNDDEMYDFKGVGAPRQLVRVNGFRRFQRGLDDIKSAIRAHGILAEVLAREIIKLEEKEPSADEEEAASDVRLLRKKRNNLEEETDAIADLEKFYKTVAGQWSDIRLRNIGHVHHSPPISVDVEGKRYTEDWGTIELDGAKFSAQFMGNVLDLGTEITPNKLTQMMYPQDDISPEGRLLKINGVVTEGLLANPDLLDGEGKPCLIVIKDGCTTGLTVGRYAGLESVLCDENGVVSVELAIYNYDKRSGPFSAKGESGSLIIDGRGRMVGQLHSGQAKNNLTSTHVTYATPAWWLIIRIKKKYPHADFNRTAW